MKMAANDKATRQTRPQSVLPIIICFFNIIIIPHLGNFCGRRSPVLDAYNGFLHDYSLCYQPFPLYDREMLLGCEHNDYRPLHIAVYPWLAMSHLTSFLRLSNKLAEKGHIRVSFFIPNKTQAKLAPHNHHPNLITFIPIDVPHIEGLPNGAETTNDVPPEVIPKLGKAMDLTRPDIEAHIARLRPDIVFFDFAYWLPEVARKHGAKSILYATSNLVRVAYSITSIKSKPKTAEDIMQPPPGFPNPALRLRAAEARGLVQLNDVEFGIGVTLHERMSICFNECDALASKTCREMEGPYCDFLEKSMGKPVLLAGPIIPKPPASILDERFDGWLKGFGKHSVVYCALGSECTLTKDQFQELVLGLELTGMPFLAALKPPIGCETIESAMPEGFLERTKGRGIVHGGWVQQPLILQHPSVGCFVTHCGAGSTSEALLSECQLVLLPRGLDQFINARFLALDLKVGLEVEKGEEDEFCTKKAFSQAILTVMDLESKTGRDVKANHAKLRKVLLKDGLEDSYVAGFTHSLRGLVGQS